MRVSGLFQRWQRKATDHQERLVRHVLRDQTDSSNGFIREKALIELAKSPAPGDWPYALKRLSDWVPNVRRQAERLVEKLLEDGHASALKDWADQLSVLARKSRGNSSNALTAIILSLSTNGELAAMWPRLGRGFRQLAVQTLLSHDRLKELLAFRKLRDLDPISIQRILREQGTVTDEELASLIDHPHPSVRKAALKSAVARGKSEMDLLHLALFDRSSRVRTTAQFLLGKQGVNARLVYLSDFTPRVIEGFCDVALTEDLERLRAHFGTSGSRQRLAVAKALIRLGDSALVIQMLSDTSSKIRRLGFGLALKQPAILTVEARQAIYQSANSGVKKTGAQLLMSQSRWESLIQILKFIGNEDESICTLARDHLSGWLRWASTSPSIPDPISFKRAVAVTLYMEAQLPEALKHELKQFLAWTEGRVHPS